MVMKVEGQFTPQVFFSVAHEMVEPMASSYKNECHTFLANEHEQFHISCGPSRKHYSNVYHSSPPSLTCLLPFSLSIYSPPVKESAAHVHSVVSHKHVSLNPYLQYGGRSHGLHQGNQECLAPVQLEIATCVDHLQNKGKRKREEGAAYV